MTRFDRRKEVPDRDSDNARRRTKPADRGPYDPKRVGELYAKGVERPNPHPRGKHGDGLAGKKVHDADVKVQKPQDEFNVDGREPSYDNDTPRGWLRGENEDGRGRHFDHGKLDPNNVPPKAKGPANRASGRDMERSPFSAAHFTGKGEG
jgi:hypothetical protein